MGLFVTLRKVFCGNFSGLHGFLQHIRCRAPFHVVTNMVESDVDMFFSFLVDHVFCKLNCTFVASATPIGRVTTEPEKQRPKTSIHCCSLVNRSGICFCSYCHTSSSLDPLIEHADNTVDFTRENDAKVFRYFNRCLSA
jgi:hypothetical protein